MVSTIFPQPSQNVSRVRQKHCLGGKGQDFTAASAQQGVSSLTTVPLGILALGPGPAPVTQQQAVGLGTCLVYHLTDFLT